MTLRRFFWIFAVFMVFAVPGQARAQVTCPSQNAGAVNVIWGSDNIQYDFTKSQRQMDRMEIDTKSPYGRGVKTHVGGLMRGGISIESRVQVASITYPRAQKICQWVDTMQVNLRIDPKIYIARQHKRGTCEHNVILEHEMKHVFVDREIVKKYVPILRNNLQKAIYKVGIVGPKDQRDGDRYQQKISDYMDKALKTVTDQLYAERRKRQQAVDTLEEYERVANACG